MMKKVLTIAGSDPSGGAGIQADIKTITAHKMYAMSVITALTSQNTTGVYGILDIDAGFISSQLDSVFTDIVPDSVKIGMVSNSKIIEIIAQKLQEYKATNIVVDPVMVSTSGSKLISNEAQNALINTLMPMASIITPNILEAQCLCGIEIRSENDMEKAARRIGDNTGVAVLVKGGHLVNDATDLLYSNGEIYRYSSKRISNPNTHGTGCTLSSAIACNLADGKTLDESIQNAKSYITKLLSSDLNIGKGNGPLDHTCLLDFLGN